MANLMWYKHYPQDSFLMLSKLSFHDRAVLPYLIDLILLKKDCLADDDKEIAHELRLDIRRWRKAKASLIAGEFIYIEDGLIHNNRASEMVEDANRRTGLQ